MKDPSELLSTYTQEEIMIRLRDGQLIKGNLHAYDEHMNVIMSNVKGCENQLLFVRGESITLIGQISYR
ncbi:hypothetical protein EDEG_02705 [Edhazardia aedis USNM 41457]|uniref:Sm domain-containing protein n=1 Tax=Edhazardia aedis (strain USNM 41457) TaxID=1003232 RepID=J9D4Y4_EDHAE|nr:hypothetical protein EDEG_02705 [Edhazardia aedis USNM 41457]|eukprot:EJW02881.1 hypothetical protein EDEG_02705 [Edhazardia aedis USNM 41457]